ncbi:hypothetical protein G7Y89_g15354 [Cudoniella acicularis]|uniref:Alcohol dehydrogenase iron-type/glycerol dehydrogenase GldA domain-containing protein n=1 Tax=Cudoniella acicularis TaxID=354080 RepID=A0A8H4VNK6_9HELO|nr:hypothetical protein G7Y89_g15354 [Cudoniella acicularis]
MVASNMITERVDLTKPFPIVSYNLPFPEACSAHMSNTLHSSKAYIIVSGSLSRSTNALQRLEEALGKERVAGVRKGMTPHTLYSELLEIAKEVKKSSADCIVTLGGGSLIDGAKGMVFALANDIDLDDPNAFDAFLKKSMVFRKARTENPKTATSDQKPSTIPIICITTTLSAGEYNPAGGATNNLTKHKQLFVDPSFTGPKIIIWDPELTLTAPEKVWLSTGLRAVDHCVERVEVVDSGVVEDEKGWWGFEGEAGCLKGGAERGSHGIGHQLGPYGVPHAETTCILMPSVQKYNSRVNATTQATLSTLLWDDPIVSPILTSHSLSPSTSDLGDILDVVIRELGFPRTLKEYGVKREDLEKIAESSLGDICSQKNAVPLVERVQVMEVLEMCYG